MKTILELNSDKSKKSKKVKLACPDCGDELDELYVTRDAQCIESGYSYPDRLDDGTISWTEDFNSHDMNDSDNYEFQCPNCDFMADRDDFVVDED